MKKIFLGFAAPAAAAIVAISAVACGANSKTEVEKPTLDEHGVIEINNKTDSAMSAYSLKDIDSLRLLGPGVHSFADLGIKIQFPVSGTNLTLGEIIFGKGDKITVKYNLGVENKKINSIAVTSGLLTIIPNKVTINNAVKLAALATKISSSGKNPGRDIVFINLGSERKLKGMADQAHTGPNPTRSDYWDLLAAYGISMDAVGYNNYVGIKKHKSENYEFYKLAFGFAKGNDKSKPAVSPNEGPETILAEGVRLHSIPFYTFGTNATSTEISTHLGITGKIESKSAAILSNAQILKVWKKIKKGIVGSQSTQNEAGIKLFSIRLSDTEYAKKMNGALTWNTEAGQADSLHENYGYLKSFDSNALIFVYSDGHSELYVLSPHKNQGKSKADSNNFDAGSNPVAISAKK